MPHKPGAGMSFFQYNSGWQWMACLRLNLPDHCGGMYEY